MAINSLNFRNRNSSRIGRLSKKTALETVDRTFKGIGLNSRAERYISEKLDTSGEITGKEFTEIVNSAHEKGLISSRKAEKMKDRANIPDGNNKH